MTEQTKQGAGRPRKPDRKQRINVTLSPDTLAELEVRIPDYQRSEYIERLIRKDFGLPEQEKKMSGFAVYERTGNNGTQTVHVDNGTIVSQQNGKPEWVGQDISVLRGTGFKRTRSQFRLQRMVDWLQSDSSS